MVKRVKKIWKKIRQKCFLDGKIYYVTKAGEYYVLYRKGITGWKDLHELIDHFNQSQFVDKKLAEKRVRELNERIERRK